MGALLFGIVTGDPAGIAVTLAAMIVGVITLG
jgi:hypothetical protein